MVVRKSSSGNVLRRGYRRQTVGYLSISASVLLAAIILASERSTPELAPVQTQIVAEFDTVELPVPMGTVAIGTKVSDITFNNVSFPRHQVPLDALQSIAPIADSYTVVPLPANLPMFRKNFSLYSEGNNPVIQRIPEGMRAMTVSVDATTSVEGWASSGAIVDVLLVRKEHTSVIAEKVKILSAERSVVPIRDDSAPRVPKTVTLLVSQEQCMAINTAIPLGRIAFALRGSTDEAAWHNVVFNSSELGDGTLDSGAVITGYVAVDRPRGRDQFALANGKWVPTSIVPEGFLVASR